MLASFYKKPIVPVNHALGHVELGMMLTCADDPLVLLVSGGHTMILAFSQKRWRVFGETLDITIGNLLDQFGRANGFSSPCGDQIERLSSRSSGTYIRLPYTVKGNDVSFSGIYSSAKRLFEKNPDYEAIVHEVFDEYRGNLVGLVEYQKAVPGLDLDKYQQQKVRHYRNRCREMGITPDAELIEQILDPEIDFVVGVQAG